jgi:hypothetical protein
MAILNNKTLKFLPVILFAGFLLYFLITGLPGCLQGN